MERAPDKTGAFFEPESVSMKAATSGMPWSIADCAVSCRLFRVNFAAILLPLDEAETEAFPATEGFHAHGFTLKKRLKNNPRSQNVKRIFKLSIKRLTASIIFAQNWIL